MAYTVKVPASVTIDGQTIDNQRAVLQGNTAMITVYVTLVDSASPEVILAGPVALTVGVNRNKSALNMRTEYYANIKKAAFDWATGEVNRITFQALLDNNISDAQLETQINS